MSRLFNLIFTFNVANGAYGNWAEVTFHQPKKPPIPEDAVVIADYMLMADFVNGAGGIAVGMATSIPPHNLVEVINATVAYVSNKDITISQLMKHIPGPDFPTGGIIIGKNIIKPSVQAIRELIILLCFEIARAIIIDLTHSNFFQRYA